MDLNNNNNSNNNYNNNINDGIVTVKIIHISYKTVSGSRRVIYHLKGQSSVVRSVLINTLINSDNENGYFHTFP